MTARSDSLVGADGSVYRDPWPRFLDTHFGFECRPMLNVDGSQYCTPEAYLTTQLNRWANSNCTGGASVFYYFTDDNPQAIGVLQAGGSVYTWVLNPANAYWMPSGTCIRDIAHQFFNNPIPGQDRLVEFSVQ